MLSYNSKSDILLSLIILNVNISSVNMPINNLPSDIILSAITLNDIMLSVIEPNVILRSAVMMIAVMFWIITIFDTWNSECRCVKCFNDLAIAAGPFFISDRFVASAATTGANVIKLFTSVSCDFSQ